MVAYGASPTGDLAHNPGMCPDWESNQRPLGFQAHAQSTEPHQPGLNVNILNMQNITVHIFNIHSTIYSNTTYACWQKYENGKCHIQNSSHF